ncbi:MAG: phosphoribosyl-AMP cyclohydrolase [Bacteroidota bacterium]
MKQKISLLSTVLALLFFVSCNTTEVKDETPNVEPVEESQPAVTISEQEVLDAQKTWGEGIVQIGKIFTEEGDYTAAAKKHIAELYGYNLGPVLFKPTLAAEKQFRTTEEGALSYFVGANENFSEDKGFAIKPWTNVRWESTGVKTEGNMAIAMGNYYFTPADGSDDVKVEYTFGYTKDDQGKLRIIMHGSFLPYSGG